MSQNVAELVHVNFEDTVADDLVNLLSLWTRKHPEASPSSLRLGLLGPICAATVENCAIGVLQKILCVVCGYRLKFMAFSHMIILCTSYMTSPH